ncbi:hypothetical protein [Phytohabitans houttuyneae]|uniref:Uncharacterized protein n=1 Tax=Phytohabitans houttuyneae TaxID=1076126 RepID=A0A6V8K5L6_9ACTN|nr:hypothetical protein [Phytohabitans houttuyneae]GFJ77449.1 hypothetical protein Phou_016290 [Phytohabitans houttuyneae]
MTIPNLSPRDRLDSDRIRALLTDVWVERTSGPVPEAVLIGVLSHLAAAARQGDEAWPASAAHEHTGDALDACVAHLIDEAHGSLFRLGAERNLADHHQRALRQLQWDVRAAGLGALAGQPQLAQTLGPALEAWGLPPIPHPYTVTLQVPITVEVDASGAEEAADLATSRLRRELRLPYGMDAAIGEAVCTHLAAE